jgi:hypothetical protein
MIITCLAIQNLLYTNTFQLIFYQVKMIILCIQNGYFHYILDIH